jgi:hypothetical protein
LRGIPEWLAFALFLPCLWIGVSVFLSWFGGWMTLARSYRLTGEFCGRRWRFRSVVVRSSWGHASYGTCVTLGASARGLCLAVFPLFRIGHAPLFVPWTDLRIAAHDWLLYSYLEFRFHRVEGVWLRVPRTLGQEVAAAGGLAVPT